MAWCVVERPDGVDEIDIGSMSFDGGSLILFSDAELSLIHISEPTRRS